MEKNREIFNEINIFIENLTIFMSQTPINGDKHPLNNNS